VLVQATGAKLDINNNIPSFAVSVPVHERFVAAVFFHTPLQFGLNFDLTGFQTKLAQEQGYRLGLYYKAPFKNRLGVSLVYNSMPTFLLNDPQAVGW